MCAALVYRDQPVPLPGNLAEGIMSVLGPGTSSYCGRILLSYGDGVRNGQKVKLGEAGGLRGGVLKDITAVAVNSTVNNKCDNCLSSFLNGMLQEGLGKDASA